MSAAKFSVTKLMQYFAEHDPFREKVSFLTVNKIYFWFEPDKSIGLRKIQVIRRPIVLDCGFGCSGKRKTENNKENPFALYQAIRIIVPGEWSIERILNELQYLINNKIGITIGTINLTYYNQTVHCDFNAATGVTCTQIYFKKYSSQSETG